MVVALFDNLGALPDFPWVCFDGLQRDTVMDEKLLGALLGGIWATPGVAMQPYIVLSRWRVLEIVDGHQRGDRHLVGFNVEDQEGRVSTTLLAFDPQKMEAKTTSGRIYRLKGQPGFDPDGDYVWQSWARVNMVSAIRDVSSEYGPLRR